MTTMLKPPALPTAALTAGKITVGLSWLAGLYGLLLADPASSLYTLGLWLTVFLVGSHIAELAIYRAFLKAAKATPADYVQVFLFGIFHSGGMKIS